MGLTVGPGLSVQRFLRALQSLAHPDFLSWTTSAEVIIMTLLRGIHVFLGPLIGSAIYLTVKHRVISFTKMWMMWLGIISALIVIFLPGGIGGFVKDLVKGRSRNNEVT